MTQQEFDNFDYNFGFWCGMQAVYCGHAYAVVTVNIKERLIGLYDGFNAKDCEVCDIMWARCENVELVK